MTEPGYGPQPGPEEGETAFLRAIALLTSPPAAAPTAPPISASER